jgi:hypothetical protein
MTEMEAWTAAVRRELELDDDPQVRLVLRLAKEVAHGVLRPAAPVTAYLAGLAVGRGADPAEVAARLSRLVEQQAGPPAEES